jgi:hypothetical protein
MPGGRRWLDEIVTGAVTSIEQIAARENCSVRQVNICPQTAGWKDSNLQPDRYGRTSPAAHP